MVNMLRSKIMLLVKENFADKDKTGNSELLTRFLRLQIPRPDNYDWKEDYANALEEKYASVH